MLISEVFLMLSVCTDNHNALQFLWVDDIEKSRPAIQEMNFMRVIFGVSSSLFLLNATINHHLNKYRDENPESVEKILNFLYVDDVTCGANTEDEAYQLFTVSNRIFVERGFNLRKFVTNSLSLQQKMTVKSQGPGHS